MVSYGKDFGKIAREMSDARNDPEGKTSFCCFLDFNDRHPELFGECILPRDDDGMGFCLRLSNLKGKLVRITIEEVGE